MIKFENGSPEHIEFIKQKLIAACEFARSKNMNICSTEYITVNSCCPLGANLFFELYDELINENNEYYKDIDYNFVLDGNEISFDDVINRSLLSMSRNDMAFFAEGFDEDDESEYECSLKLYSLRDDEKVKFFILGKWFADNYKEKE